MGLASLPAMLVGVAVLKGLSGLAYAALMLNVGQRVLEALRQDLYGHLLQLPPRFFATRHSGELLSRLLNDVSQVEFGVSQAFGSYVKDSLQLVALLVFCAWLDPRLFLLSLVVIPLAVLPVSQFARRVRGAARGTQASLGKLTAFVAEHLHNLPIVQAFRAEPAARRGYAALEREYLGGMRSSLALRGAFTPALELLALGGLAIAVAAGSRQVALEPALGPKLLSFLSAALLMYPPLRSLSGTLATSVQGAAAAERLFEVRDAPLPPPRPRRAGPLQEGLRFEGVWAHFPDGRAGLQGLSCTVRAGQRVALVGASGAGKSSALALLLGLLEPSRGQVFWDGVSLQELDLASVRAQLGWVPQEPALLAGSVRENLLLARPDADDTAVWEALRLAHADGFVRSFPHGLEEPVGEKGAQLSGGQRQRLAIARAFLRAPSLLLLDEPTRALDALSEREVQSGLAQLQHGRTALLVTHQLAAVERADLILVLGEGVLLEEGTHASLMTRGGAYSRLVLAGQLVASPPGERTTEWKARAEHG
jgi:subfamily B ATP-binding cassette protein MsbA